MHKASIVSRSLSVLVFATLLPSFSLVVVVLVMLVAQLCPTLCHPMDCSPTRPLCPWDFPGKDTGVGSHFFLQGIFPTQGSNPDLLHCRQILYRLSYKGSPYQSQNCFRDFPDCPVIITSSPLHPLSMQEVWVQSLFRELISPMPPSQKIKAQNRSKFNRL